MTEYVLSLVVSNPHVDAVGFEEVGQGGDVGLSVVAGIGEGDILM